MTSPLSNRFLICGGLLSAVAALLHIAIIIGGPDWYRFFGAGEAMAQMAEQGSSEPAIITTGIAIVLFSWSAYGFSGAGLMAKLPLIRTALIVIAAVYLLRGLGFFVASAFIPDMVTPFMVWSSIICTIYGLCYAIGCWQNWNLLSKST